jgi:hypothetical protein
VQIVCPKCGHPVRGADIDIGSCLAVCRPCGEVLPLEPPLPPDALALKVPGGLFRPTDLRWVEERQEEQSWRVSIRPRGTQAVGQLVFAVLWTGFMLTCVLLIAGSAPLFSLSLLPLVGVGGLVGYRALKALNHMVVDVDRNLVTATRRPVPEFGSIVREPTFNVVGFKATGYPLSTRGSHLLMRWGLHLLTRDGRAIPIRVDLAEGSHASYAAARLTQMLTEARQGSAPYRE